LGRFAPRRPDSAWSKINSEIAERLIREGRMKPPGLRQIEAAKQDGRWDKAYSPQRTTILSTDFMEELETNEKAKSFFGILTKSEFYIIIFMIETAKNLEQRRNRIHSIIKTLEKQKKPQL